jgi:hypothetical protein
MKIHGIMLIRNEADILRYAMRENREWCNFVYVFDNGSTDGTWELLQELASVDERIIPFQQSDRPFRDSLRGEVFRAFRERACSGDWWCRLDADEVYIDSPREFLPQIPTSHHVVWSLHYQYYLTQNEAASFPTIGTGELLPEITAENRPRYFLVNASEARFFRHRSGLQWTGDDSWPLHMGLVSPKRIRLRHFQYRSPAQIQLRLETRRRAASQGYLHFGHSLESRWEEKLEDPAKLNFEDTYDSLSQLQITSAIPNHLESPERRIFKRFMHGLRFWP